MKAATGVSNWLVGHGIKAASEIEKSRRITPVFGAGESSLGASHSLTIVRVPLRKTSSNRMLEQWEEYQPPYRSQECFGDLILRALRTSASALRSRGPESARPRTELPPVVWTDARRTTPKTERTINGSLWRFDAGWGLVT